MKPKSLYVTLSALMIGLVALVYSVLLLQEQSRGNTMLLRQAAEQAQYVGREAAAAVESELRPARVDVALLASSVLGRVSTQAERLRTLPVLAEALRSNTSVSAIYFATTSGSFMLLRRLNSALARENMGAPPGAAFGLQSVNRDTGVAVGAYSYFDADMREIERREMPDYDFDPRSRNWFELARHAGDGVAVQSQPYLFFTTGEPGVTLAEARSDIVVGADVSLETLSQLLSQTNISASAELLIATNGGELLAQSKGKDVSPASRFRVLPTVDAAASPLMKVLWHRRDGQGQLEPVQSVAGREWVAHSVTLAADARKNSAPLTLLIAAPRDELQASEIKSRRHGFYISLGLMLSMLPLVHWLANRIAQPLRNLAQQAEAITHFNFDGTDPQRSLIREVDRLATAMTTMKHTLHRFLEISSSLNAEHDFDTLMDRILRETMHISAASGGAVHLLSRDGSQLEPAALRLHGQAAIAEGPTWDVDVPHPVAAPVRALRTDSVVEMELARDDATNLAIFGSVFSSLGATRLRLLSMPLKNRQMEIIGTLTLSFPIGAGTEIQPLTSELIDLIRALSGTAALAIDNHLLLRTSRNLLASFIQLIAGAIDAKSPYTGGHCQRVPDLVKMLARATCDAKEGPFADFTMDADQWETLHIAAWLHDCGKVTTPDYVVDKATKLETIYNRIHEIRTRFEVLKRDALIERLEARLGAEGTGHARAESVDAHTRLDEEFAFIAACNHGGEYMSPEHQVRLREIAQTRWWRTLDNRLGLSAEERQRMGSAPAPLPAHELLLSDRPEHILPRPPGERLVPGNRWGFNISQPEHLYNRGELHNLSVSRGTLTSEERYKINEHMVQTIKMLGELPFPKHLQAVPEIAGGHHEQICGKGYPRGLTGAQMSPQARMMAVADVFEALTAEDRPYKPGKTLSEALEIMRRMTLDKHLDAELYELFLRSGVCMEYARRHMKSDSIDVDDVLRYSVRSEPVCS
ncbi:HD domain-containing phosphohydrolase [Paraburkholderia bryophila]|uniref:HD-GYP domain-containing protein (C-di-GMP phosphodiesterase class II) n=1 Tax=Paraburkholderia bryophila TaxID=420952 RepID=A0A7Y9WPY1_9BURK|nr:HD domain-containing phosphohydrolase [Paraburkholderia bryophila]NYH24897.1 HD-GYP domain-containing protein (c-di-GMP phosphodiesterase class II) [Paraburkholderia bryophila]